MLGGGLMMSRISDAEGSAEIGLTKTLGAGVAQGIVLNLVFDASPKSPLWVEVSDVSGNDEQGNTVHLAGSVFRSDAEGAAGSPGIPADNALMQNYPNPFNPQTTIRFQLSEPSSVSIKVFDLLGREVVSLVGGRQPAGRFSVAWDAGKVSSGIYYCRMTAQNESGHIFTQSQRMLLVK
jgi:hypothetical protein